MKMFTLCKDGGAESTVWSYILVELKSLFSVMLLRFEDGSRDAYHSHAFNCVSWVLKGELTEHMIDGTVKRYASSLMPVITRRETFHKVVSTGRSWVITFRGPWRATWEERVQGEDIRLTHGRKRCST